MKFILFLLLFFNHIFAQSYTISENLTEDNLTNFTKYLVVSNEVNLTSKEVLESNKLLDLANSNIEFNPDNSVWTLFEIKNDSSKEKTIYIINLLTLTEKIDSYIYENNSLIDEKNLGILSNNSKSILYSKFPILKLELKPNTTYKIVIQLTNKSGRINPKWIVMSEEYFFKFIFQDNIIWGFILGTLFLLLLLYVFLYQILKIYNYKSYLICIFLFLIYLFVNNGFMMSIFGRGVYNNYLAIITGYTTIFFYIAFLDEYFSLSKNKSYKFIMKIMYVLSIYLALSSFVIIFSNKLYAYEDYYMAFIFIIGVILLIFTTIETYKNNISKLFIIGQLSMFVSYYYSNLMMDSINARTTDQQLVGIFQLIQIVLFVIVIFIKLFKTAQLKDKTDKLILSQSHFSTIGQTLRNIAHQWKVPSVRLGTLITELESIFYTTNFSNKRADEILDQMRSNANFMKETITDFSTFYTNTKNEITSFNPMNEINDIKLMLIEKMNHASFTINCDDNLSNIEIIGSVRTFAHVCMIIIDNSIDMANQRNIKHPYINITFRKEKNEFVLIFKDNCGGITQKPIDSIFELEVTTHKDSNRGTGLTIAKMLIESKLNGKIKVINENLGAKFELYLKS